MRGFCSTLLQFVRSSILHHRPETEVKFRFHSEKKQSGTLLLSPSRHFSSALLQSEPVLPKRVGVSSAPHSPLFGSGRRVGRTLRCQEQFSLEPGSTRPSITPPPTNPKELFSLSLFEAEGVKVQKGAKEGSDASIWPCDISAGGLLGDGAGLRRSHCCSLVGVEEAVGG